MYRLFVAIGGFIVLVLFTALIAPYFVDWTSYKKQFELQTSRIIGQKVEVLGQSINAPAASTLDNIWRASNR